MSAGVDEAAPQSDSPRALQASVASFRGLLSRMMTLELVSGLSPSVHGLDNLLLCYRAVPT